MAPAVVAMSLCLLGCAQVLGIDDIEVGDGGGGGGDAAVVGPRSHRVEVTAQIPGPIADAPVLIALDSARIDYDAAAGDGSDLRFLDAANQPLAHEIESWDPTGTSIVWVKLPELATGTSFHMVYGDGAAATQRAADVWSEYDLVYHFSSAGSESRQGLDATAQNGALIGRGRLAGGAVLDGINDHYAIGSNLALGRAASAATISAWIRPEAVPGAFLEIATGEGSTSRMFANTLETGVVRMGVRTQDLGPRHSADGTVPVDLGAWLWVLGSADFAAGTIVIYLDGVEHARAEMLPMDPTTPDTNAAFAAVGADDGLTPEGFFAGVLDEVRASRNAVDAAWVASQYLSMTDSLLSFGPASSGTP
jgi:hypothetical protein